jgi:hypothetical protein
MTPTHLAFTGSSRYLTYRQCDVLRQLFTELTEPGLTLHHGDCIVADAYVHDLALEFGWRVEIHPPENPAKRAWCEGAAVVHPVAPYLVRNRAIVLAGSMLVAAPDCPECVRSGSWSTVRFAWAKQRRVMLAMPDGWCDTVVAR